MLMMQKIRWAVLAGAALVLSGCVAPPPPSAYNTAYSQPAYGNSAAQYYEASSPQAAYYEEGYYQPQQAYVEPSYYAPAYPVVGASFGYSIYNDGYRYNGHNKRSNKNRHFNKHHHDGVKKGHNGKGHKLKGHKNNAGKRKGGNRGNNHTARNRNNGKNISAAKQKTVLFLQNLERNREGQRASDGN